MQKHFSLLFFFLIAYSLYAQQAVQVAYGVELVKGENTPDLLNNYIDMASSSAEQIQFILEYEGNTSRFYLKESLANQDAKVALALIEYFVEVYTDAASKTKIYNNETESGKFKRQEFLITESLFTDWKLINETKKIQDFTCYKAVGEYHYKTDAGNFSKTITAWYSPEISSSFGPNGYGGLPGLILELHVGLNGALFGAKKINFNSSEVQLSIPNKGEQITKEEFDEISIKRSMKIMQMREKSRSK